MEAQASQTHLQADVGQSPYMSVIVPLYNEEDSVPHMHARICEALDPIGISYEMLFVNDGSKDKTLDVAKAISETDPKLRVVELRKNYGQTPAMAAGIDSARGKVLVTMDGDLQNDPSDIPMMLNKLEEGYDIVVGWRHNRQDKLITRKIPSMIANRLIGKVTGVPIKDNGCSLKVYRADIMKAMPFYSEMHRFIPALLSVGGTRVAEVKVKHHARQFGESKYGLSRIYKVLFDLLTIKTITSVTSHPVRWFAKLSIVPALISLYFMGLAAFQLATESNALISSSIAILFMSSSGFILGLGILAESIYQKGELNVSNLATLTTNSNQITETQTGSAV